MKIILGWHRSIVVASIVGLLCSACGLGAATLYDDFNDDTKNPAKWSSSDEEVGKGRLNEFGHRLVYSTSGAPTGGDTASREWIAGRAQYNADWAVQLSVGNNTFATNEGQRATFGLRVRGTNDDDEAVVEIHSNGDPVGSRMGFRAALNKGDTADEVVGGDGLTNGAIRIQFNSTLKVLSMAYSDSPSPTEESQWTELGTFGIGSLVPGSAGSDDWGLGENDQMRVFVYGYSANVAVTQGTLFGDNFIATDLAGEVVVHDLAVTKVTVPKVVTRTEKIPAPTKRVTVTVQNRSPHTETINTVEQFTNLVTLKVVSLFPDACEDIDAVLHSGPPQKTLPIVLKPRQQFNVVFDVTFGCAGDPLKGAGHEDYAYVATVHHEVLGDADSHAECDTCPRAPLGVDPNPNGKIKDKGCGSKQSDGTLGGDILTDVISK